MPWRGAVAVGAVFVAEIRDGQRIGDALAVEIDDGVMDGLVERGDVCEGLVGEVMGLKIAPDRLDVVEFGGVFQWSYPHQQTLARRPGRPRTLAHRRVAAAASITPPARVAAWKLLQQLFAEAALGLNAAPADLIARDGRIETRMEPKRGMSFADTDFSADCRAAAADALDSTPSPGSGQAFEAAPRRLRNMARNGNAVHR